MSTNIEKKSESKIDAKPRVPPAVGSVLVQIELKDLAPTMATFAATIDENDLLKDEKVNQGKTIEKDTHITVHIGAKSIPFNFKRFLSQKYPPFKVLVGKLSCFSNKDRKFEDDSLHSFDILFADVEDPTGILHRLNQDIVTCTQVENDYAFSPHVTIAYLKHGLAQKYIDKAEMPVTEVLVKNLKFSKFRQREVPSEIITLDGVMTRLDELQGFIYPQGDTTTRGRTVPLETPG